MLALWTLWTTSSQQSLSDSTNSKHTEFQESQEMLPFPSDPRLNQQDRENSPNENKQTPLCEAP